MTVSEELRRIDALLEKYSAEIRKAFLAGVADVSAGADLRRIVDALERGDVNAALRALNLNPASFRSLDLLIQQAFAEAGADAVALLPRLRDLSGARVAVRFDPGYPRAANWARSRSSRLITEIVDDQRVSVQATLAEGLLKGTGPRSLALDLIGRIDPRTQKRTGGIVGLHSSQAQWSRTAMGELRSGELALMRNYLTRKARDRRFDGSVHKAIEAGKPLDLATAQRAIGSMNNRLLAYRGETIAGNESSAAVSEARQEALRQTFDLTAITDDMVERTWRSTRDKRTRETHRQMNGQMVEGMEAPFRSTSGALLRYPHDPSAPSSETIKCRCAVTVKIRQA